MNDAQCAPSSNFLLPLIPSAPTLDRLLLLTLTITIILMPPPPLLRSRMGRDWLQLVPDE